MMPARKRNAAAFRVLMTQLLNSPPQRTQRKPESITAEDAEDAEGEEESIGAAGRRSRPG
jgi:hypothetical protein